MVVECFVRNDKVDAVEVNSVMMNDDKDNSYS